MVSAISYLPFGPVLSYTLDNGQTVIRTYDTNYQLIDVTSPVLNLHFGRDVVGNEKEPRLGALFCLFSFACTPKVLRWQSLSWPGCGRFMGRSGRP